MNYPAGTYQADPRAPWNEPEHVMQCKSCSCWRESPCGCCGWCTCLEDFTDPDETDTCEYWTA